MRAGRTIDGTKVRFWARKSDAIEAARSIRWPAKCVAPCHTRFQGAWAILKPYEGPDGTGEFMTREEYGARYHEWNTVKHDAKGGA